MATATQAGRQNDFNPVRSLRISFYNIRQSRLGGFVPLEATIQNDYRKSLRASNGTSPYANFKRRAFDELLTGSTKLMGFYIYCVRPHGGDAQKISARGGSALGGKAKGIKFGSEMRSIPFKDIEAVVSEVNLSKFNAKTIKERLQEDAKWTEINVKRHHEIMAEANKTSAVIPMKFGTFYKTKKNLEATLAKYYGKFKKLLTRVAGKQEWGVKGYLEYKKFAEILKKKNKEIQKLEKKRSSVPEGMKWYVDRKSDEIIAGQIEYEVEEELRRIVGKLEKRADEIRLNDLLPKVVSELGKDMILNAACLVKNDALDEFKKMIREIAAECDCAGITLFLTGPWPPYNFVEIKNNDKK